MRTHPLRPNLALILSCLLALLLFFLGLAGAGSHLWGRYLLPILVAFLWGRRRDIYTVTALASVLVAAEYWTGDRSPNDLLINHLLPILILWGAAWLLARRHTALQASEQRFAKVFGANPGGIAITRQVDGRFLEANDAYLAMVGCTREQLIGRTSHDLGILTAEQRDQIRAAILEDGFVHGLDVQIHNAQGQVVDASYSVEQMEFGGERCFLILAIDMTERTRLEEAAGRLAAIVASSSDAIVSTDLQGRVVSWNRSAEQLYECSESAAMGRPISELLPTGHDTDETEIVARIRGGAAVPVADRIWTKADGTKVDLSVILSPVIDRNGKVIGAASLARDITARKQMEEALTASERKYRDLYDNSPDMYFVGVPAQGLILDCNQTLALTLGYTPAELIGGPSSTLFDAASYTQMQKDSNELLAAGRDDNYEIRLRRRDGTMLDAIMSVTLEHDPAGGPARARVTLHDITERKHAEEQRRASEEKFTRFFAANPAAVCVTRRADDVYVEVNEAYLELTGYTRDELIGRPYPALGVFSPTYRADLQAVVLAEGRLYNVETEIIGRSGTPIDCLVSVETIEVDGAPCSLTMMVDITERKRAEVALAAGEARLRAVIENTADSIWSVDRNYCFLVGNAAFTRGVQLQIGRSLAVGDCVLDDPFPPSTRVFWQPLYDRALAGETFMLEIPSGFHHPAGTLACYLNPIYAADGAITGVTGRAADITALKQAEAQLREAYQRLQLAVDAADIGIWNWNFVDDSLDWDDRICDFYAVPRAMRAAGIYQQLWRSRVHPDDLAAVDAELAVARRDGTEWSSAFRVVWPDGQVRHIFSACVVEHDRHGVPVRMIGINRDITDQMQYERLLQDTNAVLEERVAARTADLQTALAELQRASQLKDEFMAMISHELRTPLTGVLSMSEMLEEQIAGPLNDRQVTYVKGITQSGERLLAVINGILSYTHLLSGKVKLDVEPCELAHLLDICAASQQYKVAAKHQTIAVQVAPPDLTITADATALAEVLKRLLDNAVKFTPDGGRIGLEARPGAASHTVDLVVWDTGIGIAADQLDNVFHAFIQADARLARSHEGIGIGLAYADEMVRLMGGSVAVASTLGAGSRFTITLSEARW